MRLIYGCVLYTRNYGNSPSPSNIFKNHSQFLTYCLKYHRSRRQFQEDLLSINGLRRPAGMNGQKQNERCFKAKFEYLGLKKIVCFLLPYRNRFLFKKIPTLKFFSALQTSNQHKTCIKHTFLTKKIMQTNFFHQPTYPIFFKPLQETKNIFLLVLWVSGKKDLIICSYIE